MVQQRTFKIGWIDKNRPGALSFENKAGETMKYNGKKTIVKVKSK